MLALPVVVPPAAAAGDETPKAPDAKPIFLEYKCRSCHSIESQEITRKVAEEGAASEEKPPDLSGVGLRRKADWIVAFLLKKEAIEGRKHEKKFRGTDEELQKLAAWLASLRDEKGAKKEKKEKPQE